jgi:hypothetical protein
MEDKEGGQFVLEFDSQKFLDGKRTAADNLGIWCHQISDDQFSREKYHSARYYRMSDPLASKIFLLEQWVHFLKSSNGRESSATC